MTSLAIRNPWTPADRVTDVTLAIVTGPATEPLTIPEIKSQLRIDTTDGEPAPSAPTVALISPAAAGNCDNGAWRIAFTHVTAAGETELGAVSAVVTVADKTVNGKIAVTGIQLGGSNVTARNAYALAPGETVYKYVGQIANNTATVYTVNIAAASLGVQAPTTNTTEDAYLTTLRTVAREYAERRLWQRLITQTVTAKMDAFPGSISGRSSFVGGPSWTGIGSAGWQYPIVLPEGPLLSVTSIAYVDTAGAAQTWSSALYTVDEPNRRIVPIDGEVYPSTATVPNAVTITCVMGYGAASAVPVSYKQGMLLLIGHWYERREAVNVGNITSELPFAVDVLLPCPVSC